MIEPFCPPGDYSHRVVLLGASNLTRSLATIVATIQTMLDGPLDILTAIGHGRSYGMASRVLWRGLPGITECGLWSALRSRPQLPTLALIGDVGNDIMYEAPVPRILEWVAACIDQLQQVEAKVTMTLVPVQAIAALGQTRFLLARTILFPSSGMRLHTAKRQVERLERGLEELAQTSGIQTVSLRPEWYGIDPIHITMWKSRQAWRTILEAWCHTEAGGAALEPVDIVPPPENLAKTRLAWRDWLKTRTSRPQLRWLCGLPQHAIQPSCRLNDGTVISAY